jgi:hypothetical protein
LPNKRRRQTPPNHRIKNRKKQTREHKKLMRNLRNEQLAGGGFFAFQDIITTVIALVVLLILILISGGNNLLQSETTQREDVAQREQQQKSLNAKHAEIARLEQKLAEALRTQMTRNVGGGTNPALVFEIVGKVAAIEKRIKSLRGHQNQSQEKTLSATTRNKVETQAEIKQKEKELAKQEKTKTEKTEEAEKLSEQTLAAEAELNKRLKRENKLWIIPEQSDSTKTPIFGIVSAEGVKWTIYKSAKTIPESTWAGAAQALSNFSTTDYYVVLYFKPSGIGGFDRLRKSIRSSGFELGYDLVGEDTDLNFATTEEPQ